MLGERHTGYIQAFPKCVHELAARQWGSGCLQEKGRFGRRGGTVRLVVRHGADRAQACSSGGQAHARAATERICFAG